MPFSTTCANNILNFLFSKVGNLTAPSSVYLGLTTNGQVGHTLAHST